MAEKLDLCPKCGKVLSQFGYDMQQCICGWNAMGVRPERLPREPKPPAEYTKHIEGACGLLAQGVPLTEELLASVAISLKRIADALDRMNARRGVGADWPRTRS